MECLPECSANAATTRLSRMISPAGQSCERQAIPNQTEKESADLPGTRVLSTTRVKLRNILIPNQLREEMGACNSLFSPKHQDEDAEGRMRVLQEENRKLHEIVSSLQMELHQQRSEVMRMNYMLKEEQHLTSTYKTRYWRLRMEDLLSARRAEATRGRSS